MDIFADFAARVAAELKTLYPEASDELIARAVVEPPRDAAGLGCLPRRKLPAPRAEFGHQKWWVADQPSSKPPQRCGS